MGRGETIVLNVVQSSKYLQRQHLHGDNVILLLPRIICLRHQYYLCILLRIAAELRKLSPDQGNHEEAEEAENA